MALEQLRTRGRAGPVTSRRDRRDRRHRLCKLGIERSRHDDAIAGLPLAARHNRIVVREHERPDFHGATGGVDYRFRLCGLITVAGR